MMQIMEALNNQAHDIQEDLGLLHIPIQQPIQDIECHIRFADAISIVESKAKLFFENNCFPIMFDWDNYKVFDPQEIKKASASTKDTHNLLIMFDFLAEILEEYSTPALVEAVDNFLNSKKPLLEKASKISKAYIVTLFSRPMQKNSAKTPAESSYFEFLVFIQRNIKKCQPLGSQSSSLTEAPQEWLDKFQDLVGSMYDLEMERGNLNTLNEKMLKDSVRWSFEFTSVKLSTYLGSCKFEATYKTLQQKEEILGVIKALQKKYKLPRVFLGCEELFF